MRTSLAEPLHVSEVPLADVKHLASPLVEVVHRALALAPAAWRNGSRGATTVKLGGFSAPTQDVSGARPYRRFGVGPGRYFGVGPGALVLRTRPSASCADRRSGVPRRA